MARTWPLLGSRTRPRPGGPGVAAAVPVGPGPGVGQPLLHLLLGQRLQVDVDGQHQVVARPGGRSLMTRTGLPSASTSMRRRPGVPRRPRLVVLLDPALADLVVERVRLGGLARLGRQLALVDLADVAEDVGGQRAVGVGPQGGALDHHRRVVGGALLEVDLQAPRARRWPAARGVAAVALVGQPRPHLVGVDRVAVGGQVPDSGSAGRPGARRRGRRSGPGRSPPPPPPGCRRRPCRCGRGCGPAGGSWTSGPGWPRPGSGSRRPPGPAGRTGGRTAARTGPAATRRDRHPQAGHVPALGAHRSSTSSRSGSACPWAHQVTRISGSTRTAHHPAMTRAMAGRWPKR